MLPPTRGPRHTTAPAGVRKVLEELPPARVREVAVEREAFELAQTYIERGALSARWLDDALHVAVATVSRADLILSWNFKHIVNYNRIRQFNSINLALGYPQIDIRSPLEVIYADEDQDL